MAWFLKVVIKPLNGLMTISSEIQSKPKTLPQRFAQTVLGINLWLTVSLGSTSKSHIRFIDYPVTGVRPSGLKWDAPCNADGDIVTTSMET